MSIFSLRRLLTVLSLVTVFLVAACASGTYAQGFRQREALDPSKAQALPTSTLSIQSGAQSYPFVVELADTQDERSIGLMHRNYLAPDHGMLFDFEIEQQERFWMRNTFIPLDMLFVRADGEIALIAQNTIPHDERPVGPRQAVRAVLELPGGTAERLHLKTGDVVHHPVFGNAAKP